MFLETPRLLVLFLALIAPAAPALADGVKISHLYNLSDFSGTIPYSGGRLVADPHNDEVYVAASNRVRVFNRSGMETYSFGYGPDFGLIRDLAIDESGDILVLTQEMDPFAESTFRIMRCDFRGAEKGRFAVNGVPAEFAGIRPDRIFYRNGRLYVVSRDQRLVVAVDAVSGTFHRGYDLAALLEIPEEDRSAGISGFSIDDAENMLFTIPVLFRAFVVAPDGKVASFGKPGSTPGSFSVVAGIVVDNDHYFVADIGRSAVLVFDKEFRFVSEFGYAGDRPENLVRPNDLAGSGSGRIYVTQMRNRGVAAFSVSFE